MAKTAYGIYTSLSRDERLSLRCGLLIQQNNRGYHCGQLLRLEGAVLDHDHLTGDIRGLEHATCNSISWRHGGLANSGKHRKNWNKSLDFCWTCGKLCTYDVEFFGPPQLCLKCRRAHIGRLFRRLLRPFQIGCSSCSVKIGEVRVELNHTMVDCPKSRYSGYQSGQYLVEKTVKRPEVEDFTDFDVGSIPAQDVIIRRSPTMTKRRIAKSQGGDRNTLQSTLDLASGP